MCFIFIHGSLPYITSKLGDRDSPACDEAINCRTDSLCVVACEHVPTDRQSLIATAAAANTFPTSASQFVFPIPWTTLFARQGRVQRLTGPPRAHHAVNVAWRGLRPEDAENVMPKASRVWEMATWVCSLPSCSLGNVISCPAEFGTETRPKINLSLPPRRLYIHLYSHNMLQKTEEKQEKEIQQQKCLRRITWRSLGHARSISGSDCPVTWLLRAQINWNQANSYDCNFRIDFAVTFIVSVYCVLLQFLWWNTHFQKRNRIRTHYTRTTVSDAKALVNDVFAGVYLLVSRITQKQPNRFSIKIRRKLAHEPRKKNNRFRR